MTVNDIKRGDELMLFDANGKSIGGATSHTLTVTPDTTDINCKDAGIWGWKKTTKINWEISSENLFLESAYEGYLDNVLNDAEILVFFGESENYTQDGLSETKTEYKVTPNSPTTSFLYRGKAKISSLTLNANSGDNATYSVTLTGVGPLTKIGSGDTD